MPSEEFNDFQPFGPLVPSSASFFLKSIMQRMKEVDVSCLFLRRIKEKEKKKVRWSAGYWHSRGVACAIARIERNI